MMKVGHASRNALRYLLYGIAIIFGVALGFLSVRTKSSSHQLMSEDVTFSSTAFADAPGCAATSCAGSSCTGTSSATSGGAGTGGSAGTGSGGTGGSG